MKFINNWSGGLCSFWAGMRMVERHGPANVVNLFADVMIEDEELYEFNEEASAVMGVPITRISLEMSPWELFRKEGLIGNDFAPICSLRLKREPLNDWMARNYQLDHSQANFLVEDGTVVLGFDHNEWNRVNEFQAAHSTWRLVAPMAEPPGWDKCKMITEARALGLIIPRLYEMGFPHNNCGGACVRAGISHFVNLYHRLPAVFWKWAAEELYTQRVFRDRGIENWNYTILKDRRGGETKPLPLIELARRIQSGEKFDRNDWGGCGCGGAN